MIIVDFSIKRLNKELFNPNNIIILCFNEADYPIFQFSYRWLSIPKLWLNNVISSFLKLQIPSKILRWNSPLWIGSQIEGQYHVQSFRIIKNFERSCLSPKRIWKDKVMYKNGCDQKCCPKNCLKFKSTMG
jgi:hypothetical protein